MGIATMRHKPGKIRHAMISFMANLSIRTRFWTATGAIAAITIVTAIFDLSGLARIVTLLIAILGGGLLATALLGPIRRAVIHLDPAEPAVQQLSGAENVAAATEQFSQSTQKEAVDAGETGQAAGPPEVETVQAATIERLNRSLQKIGDITSIIADIAGQTDLLALNAAFEAARAGERGRGFAVAADEVRKLVERTSSSVTAIAATVHEIESVTQQAVASMENAAREVEAGIGKLRASVAGRGELTGSRTQVTDGAASMQRITDLIENNTRSAHAARQSVGELLAAARQLDALVKTFELHRRRA